MAPYFYGDMDAAGYSDWIWYGPSPIHDYGYHELLSGEWAAAIYYDGIDTMVIDPNTGDRQAMWLTKNYVYPGWQTNSDFVFGGICAAQQNPNNPTPLNDTGKSVIYNDEVEITIDYEVVDVNSIGVGTLRSPMTYRLDPNSTVTDYLFSDQYIFLQTYTIRNLKSTTLTGLEFYQFLHSHGADEYSPYVNSTYCDTEISDPLAGYTPYNSVHQTGNFRYDITQWNGPQFGRANHIDYVGFSSTVEPDWIDNDVFEGHGGKPSIGTHINIENRTLNDANSIYSEEVGGAMGWDMGTLDPNETTSMTIAFMFAPYQDTPGLRLTKTIVDANSCYNPGDEFTYTITWENLGSVDAENAVLTDYLPAGLTYPVTYSFNPDFTISSSDPNYGIDDQHTYTWNIGTIPANSSGSVTLTVIMNEKAPPGMTVTNRAVLETSIGSVTAYHYTPVCCWDDSGIIYVDEDAKKGANSGLNWIDAYTDLQDALARANANCWSSTEIRVAEGIYDPGRKADDTFVLPDNVSVYGGYKGGSVNGNERDIKRYLTVLAGDIDAVQNETVVRMGDNCLLDGFTVTGSAFLGYGVYGNGVDFEIVNCTVSDNESYGIWARNGDVTVKWCKIQLNGSDGIYHRGTGYTLTLENSWALRNGECGIWSEDSTPTMRNSVVSESDLKELANAGIRIENPTGQPKLHNLTISNNKAEGIYLEHSDPNYFLDENSSNRIEVKNCIVYFNNGNGPQFSQRLLMNLDRVAHYSCIADCNEVNDNTNGEPGFAYVIDPNGTPDPNNYHLSAASICRDAGSPYLSYANQTDFDSEERVIGSYADIGADELYSCDGDYTEDDFYHALDWNADGAVNYVEFSKFSAAWLSHDPNDPAWIADPNLADPNLSEPWNPICNLDPNGNSAYVIDLADIEVFVYDTPWLWEACWRDNYIAMYGMSGGSESMMMAAPMTESLSTESLSSVYYEPLDPVKAFTDTIKLSEMNSIDKTIVQILGVVEQELEIVKKKESDSLLEIKAFLEDCLADIRLQK